MESDKVEGEQDGSIHISVADDIQDIPDTPVSEAQYYGLTQAQFDAKYGRVAEPNVTCCDKVKKQCQCSRSCLLNTFLARFPVINMVRSYKLKEYILGDIVSGLSVGVMTVPQSMGYALLAQVPPIMGLYTSFFPVILYCMFSSSRHVAIGTMALSSLIIGSTIQRGTMDLAMAVEQDRNNTELIEELDKEKISIAVSVTFMSGLFLILMSLLKMSFVVSYIGEQFISGFLTGANLQVLTHQVKLMLGVTVGSYTGIFSWLKLVIDIFKNIATANVASIIIAIISLTLLIFTKYFINERFKARLPVPVPIDFIVVVVSTIAAYYGKFEEKFGVKIVKTIPKGVPTPTVPSGQHMIEYIPDAIALAVIGYLLMYMMAILFSRRHNYPCDPDQELFACGIANTFGGFFACIGASSSPPRCFVMELTGGKTQLAYFISGIMVLLIMLFLAPLLEALPICVLASIILVACIPLFEQYRMCVTYWRTNKYDFSIWLVTAVSTLFGTIDLGMAVGIGYSFMVTVYKTQRPFTSLLVPSSDGILLDPKRYSNVDKEPPGMKIFAFDGPVYFATVDIFKAKFFKVCVSPSELETLQLRDVGVPLYDNLKEKEEGEEMLPIENNSTSPHHSNNIVSQITDTKPDDLEDDPDERNGTTNLHTPLTLSKADSLDMIGQQPRHNIHTIIIDCNRIPFTDTPGAKCFASLHSEYDKFGIRLALAGCTEDVRAQFLRVPQCEELRDKALYPSVQDAIAVCSHNIKTNSLNIVNI